MSDSIKHDPRVVYANALREAGLLASWTYSRGIVVLPKTTSSIDPQERVPICVEYMNATDLDSAYNNAFSQAGSLGKYLAENFEGMTSSLKRLGDNFSIAIMSSAFTVAANQIAPLSVKPFEYALIITSGVFSGLTAICLKDHFEELSERDQNLIALKVAHNNLALCEGELKKRGVFAVIEAQPD